MVDLTADTKKNKKGGKKATKKSRKRALKPSSEDEGSENQERELKGCGVEIDMNNPNLVGSLVCM